MGQPPPSVRVLSRRRAVACGHARYLCTAGRDAIKVSAGGMQKVARALKGASRLYILLIFVCSEMPTVDRSSVASHSPGGSR